MVSVLLEDENILFLHVPKTAGGSISRALVQRPNARRLPVEGMDKAEPCAQQLARRLPRPIETFRTIAFVRNPWDWAVSGFLHVTQNRPAYAAPPDFETFLTGDCDPPDQRQYPTKFETPRAYVDYHSAIQQLAHLTVAGEPIQISAFGRFERVEDDASLLLGILPGSLPHANASERDVYKSYYTPKTRSLVETLNAELIDRFGYRF